MINKFINNLASYFSKIIVVEFRWIKLFNFFISSGFCIFNYFTKLHLI